MLDLAEGTPVVGHITAGVYAATGDLKKAENVAIEATKSTVVMAAGIAGAACGPGAAACGATFAVAANGAWDLTDSVVAGESRGVVKQVEKMVRRQKSFCLKIVNSGCHLSYTFPHFEINLHLSYNKNRQLRVAFVIKYHI